MGQIFHPSANSVFRVVIFGGLFIAAGVAFVVGGVVRSPYMTAQGVAIEQTPSFSHKHHVGDLGLDCRYCHTSVETSGFAGMPSTKTCMNCHSQIWADSPMLEPVRSSFRTGESLTWSRVHDLPDYVYFNHGLHVSKGIGCSSCHGRVDQMPLMWRDQSLQMQWCLDCHREPERFVRPKDQVFNMDWQPPADQAQRGRELVKQYNIKSKTSCSACHR
jgi:hypothetical protein